MSIATPRLPVLKHGLLALSLAAALGGSLSLLPIEAQAQAKGARSADVDIPYQQFTLPNGLRVIVHTDRKAPIVAVNIWYHVGSKDEPAGRSGFAHLFEHLMFNGSENHPGEFFEPFEFQKDGCRILVNLFSANIYFVRNFREGARKIGFQLFQLGC